MAWLDHVKSQIKHKVVLDGPGVQKNDPKKASKNDPENVQKMSGKCSENVRKMSGKNEKVVRFDQKDNSETMFDYKKRLQTQNYLRKEPVTY